MRAVISVVGKDHPGILAFVASKCAEKEINIVDVTQKVLQGDSGKVSGAGTVSCDGRRYL